MITASAPSSSSTAATLPAASGGALRLPLHVFVRHNKNGRACYGAHVSTVGITGHKGMVSLGSKFVNAESASLAASVFKISASVDPATGNITLKDDMSKHYKGQMCSIYLGNTSMDVTKMCVVDVLGDILAKILARRNSKRKRSSEADGNSGAAAGVARAAAAAAPKKKKKRKKPKGAKSAYHCFFAD